MRNSRKLRNAFCAVFFVAYMTCETDCSAATENEPATTARHSSNTDERAAEGAKFLKTLHELILNPPMTPEKVTASFGWKAIKQSDGENGRYTYFDLYPNALWKAPSLRQTNEGKTRIRIQLRDGSLCVYSDQVIAEFGNDFKHSLASIDGPITDSTKSDMVKRNLKLFTYGPL